MEHLPDDVLVQVLEHLVCSEIGALRQATRVVSDAVLHCAVESILERRFGIGGKLPSAAARDPVRCLVALRTAELRFLARLVCGPEPVLSREQAVSPPAASPSARRRLFSPLPSDEEPESSPAEAFEAAAVALPTPLRRGGGGLALTPLRDGCRDGARAYWVSKTWIKNLVKWSERHEARAKALLATGQGAQKRAKTPRSARRGGGSTRKERLRDRRSSEVVAPWGDVNADIRCRHGRLALKSAGRARRRAVSEEAWRALCAYYPEGSYGEFHTDCEECGVCRAQQERTGCNDCDRATMLTLMHRMYEIQSDVMSALLQRKKAFPQHLQRRQRSTGGSSLSRCPLQPGGYVVLPRGWMIAWRNFIRKPTAPKPEPFDIYSSNLLCAAHGRFMPPTNLTAFLAGEKSSPLAGGADGEGAVACEILSAQEWQELREWYPAPAVPEFCVQSGVVSWTRCKVGCCQHCVPGVHTSAADAEAMTPRRRGRTRSEDFGP